jgi:protein-S-isoprenylcysteine O-methyltransferase Ste14
MEAWKHIRAIILLPGIVMIVIPGLILWLAGTDSFGLWRSVPALRFVLPLIGGICICLGLLLMVATIRLFVTVGKGTLAPWEPTQRLVVQGVYRHVRNPMISETLASPPGVSCPGIAEGSHRLRLAGTLDGPRPVPERLYGKAWRVTRRPATFHPVFEAPPRSSILKSPVVVLKSLISGVILVLLGESVLTASLPLFCWFLVVVVVNAAYIPLSEEPGLVKRFGEEYLTYKRNVPRWVPRWMPWHGGFRNQS